MNLIQVLQDRIALAIIHAHDLLRHGTVNEQTFPACNRVDTNKRVSALNVLGSGIWVVTVEIGVRRTVDGVLAVDDLAEVGR